MRRRALLWLEAGAVLAVLLAGYLQGFAAVGRWLSGVLAGLSG